MRTAIFVALLACLLISTSAASAQSLSGGGSGGGAIQGGSAAPGGGTGLPGAVANGTTKHGIGTSSTHGRHFQHHYHPR